MRKGEKCLYSAWVLAAPSVFKKQKAVEREM